MIFTEFRFVVFFALVFAVHWALRANTARKAWLLGASWFFYAAWDWRFLGLILFSTVVDYAVGAGLAREDRAGRRKLLLFVSLAGNLGLLGVFKYFDFFVTSGASILGLLGLDVTGEAVLLAHLFVPVQVALVGLHRLLPEDLLVALYRFQVIERMVGRAGFGKSGLCLSVPFLLLCSATAGAGEWTVSPSIKPRASCTGRIAGPKRSIE